jgi:hypothetical protein
MKKLTKIDTNEFPLVESAKTIEEYGASVWNSPFTLFENHLSPPIDYWVAGDIVGDIECGEPLKMKRYIRNGVEVEGIFYTSPVETIHGVKDEITYIETKNSLYKIEEYDAVS